MLIRAALSLSRAAPSPPTLLSISLFPFVGTSLGFCPANSCHQKASQTQAHAVDPSRCPTVDARLKGAQGSGKSRQKCRATEREEKALALAVIFGYIFGYKVEKWKGGQGVGEWVFQMFRKS